MPHWFLLFEPSSSLQGAEGLQVLLSPVVVALLSSEVALLLS